MNSAGIYIHIPFCRSRCSYCDFATGLYECKLAESYVQALISEFKSSSNVDRSQPIDTIYFGGGSPSMLTPQQINLILTELHDRFAIDSGAEMTMEINPGSVTSDTLEAFRKSGINRASFGAQTFDDAELAKLGRWHTTKQTLDTLTSLRAAGFNNISFDLIAGLPGQTLERWQQNVDLALSLRPEHLSFYFLEVHAGTPLAEHIRRGIQPEPDDDLAAVMYEWMLERAAQAGYENYEISNLCLPGYESRHNSKYWTGDAYFGFGCSAHSYDGNGRRWSNERDVSRYIDLIEIGASPLVAENELSRDEMRSEAVFLGMRLMKGLSVERYRKAFGVDLPTEYASDLDRFRAAGLIEFDGELLRLTRAGALLSNEVFAAFI